MLPWRYQILGHLLAGLLIGSLLALGLQAAPAATAERARPFVTHADMLAVTVLLRRDAPPEVLAVTPLAAGRISAAAPGDYQLTVEDAHQNALYTQSFRAVFLRPGEPPVPVDEVRVILVVPGGRAAARVAVSGPHGSAHCDLVGLGQEEPQ